MMMNVCVFVDSIGKGVELDMGSGRYKPLKLDLFEPLGSNQNISLKNYSMFGCTVTRGLSVIERYAENLSNYKYTILVFGGNDCNFMWNEIADAPEVDHQPKNPLDVFMSTYKNMIGKIQNAGAKPILLTLPPLHAERFFDWVSKGLNARNILKFMGGVDRIYRWQEMYSLAVLKLGKNLNVPVVDIRSEFICRKDLSELICEDGMHPTSKGYELIVKTVCDQLS
ncbi:MAG: GDSL-type esterase/lipase family protein [Clostridiales bacterium]|nr:GDSL-type esterase/lipase family protein [Clostridiales bacterium]